MRFADFAQDVAYYTSPVEDQGGAYWQAAVDNGLTAGFPLGEGFVNLHPMLSDDNIGRFMGWLIDAGRITFD